MEYHGTNGDDTLSESGLGIEPGSLIYAGNGNDSVTVSYANAIGGAGNDIITALTKWAGAAYFDSPTGVVIDLAAGTAQDGFGTVDRLVGVHTAFDSNFSDRLTGSGTDDTFWLSRGNDTVDGGAGYDTVTFYNQKSTEFDITYDAATATFTVRKHTAAGDSGTDRLTGIEAILFTGPDSDNVTYTPDMFAPVGGFLRSTVRSPSDDMGTVDQLRTGDFNGDGKVDILATRTKGDVGATPVALQVMLGDGAGKFIDHSATVFAGGVQYVHYVPRIYVADFNNDGVTDIFAPDFGLDAPPFPGGQNSLYVSGPDKQLQNLTSTLPQALRQNHGTSIGDVNNDGYADILVNALNERTGHAEDLLVNNGAGRFVSSPNLEPAAMRAATFNPGHTNSLLADVNGDGYADMVLGTWDPNPAPSQVYLNNGHGSFANSVPIALPRSPVQKEIVLDIQRVDLNGDDLPDLVLSLTNGGDHGIFYQTPYIQLLVNDGGGHFHDETASRLPQVLPTPVAGAGAGPWYKLVTPVDLNRDGFQDLVIDGMSRPSMVYMNDGQGHFNATWQGGTGQHVTTADVDSDGLVDIIQAGPTSYDVLLNKMANGHVYRADFDGGTMRGSSGNDSFIGRAAADTVQYSGARANFSLQWTANGLTVRDKTAAEGIDTLTGIDHVRFGDMTVNLHVEQEAAAIAAASVKLLEELYVGFFNRTPDADGLAYWIGQLKAGVSIDSIADAFYSSAIAFQSLTGYSASMTNADFVRVIYKNVLGRSGDTAPPDPDVNFWAGRLASGAETKGSLLTQMLGSAHTFKGDATWGWVADLLDNKAYVADYVAIQHGLTYLTGADSITKGMAIAAAVTPTDFHAAVALVGIDDPAFVS
ncbi:FG-GAP-like repeat-containing protein [Ramlibacter sp. PS4R-6]|uniref:FG-GAP-like repeat-containing protein n=1 Tax=Ramlibacter sp. PS4R-6 TaxID=3133438 RepID=UPI0030A6DE9C